MLRIHPRLSRGFSVVEVIIVLAIVALMAAIIVPGLQHHHKFEKRFSSERAEDVSSTGSGDDVVLLRLPLN